MGGYSRGGNGAVKTWSGSNFIGPNLTHCWDCIFKDYSWYAPEYLLLVYNLIHIPERDSDTKEFKMDFYTMSLLNLNSDRYTKDFKFNKDPI